MKEYKGEFYYDEIIPFDSKPILDLLEKYLFTNSFPNYAAACGRLDMSLPTFARKLNGMLSVYDKYIKQRDNRRSPFICFSEFDKYSIEHIFPQTPEEGNGMICFNDRELIFLHMWK